MSELTKADLTAALAAQTKEIAVLIQEVGQHLTDEIAAAKAETAAVNAKANTILEKLDTGARLDAHEDVMRDLAAEVGKPQLAKRLRVYEHH